MDPARFRAASAKLETDPYDLDAWSLVIKEAQTKVNEIESSPFFCYIGPFSKEYGYPLSIFFQPVDHSRDTFERLVEKFPTSGRYWKMYIDHEVSEYPPHMFLFTEIMACHISCHRLM